MTLQLILLLLYNPYFNNQAFLVVSSYLFHIGHRKSPTSHSGIGVNLLHLTGLGVEALAGLLEGVEVSMLQVVVLGEALVKLRVSLWVILREQLLANALVPKIGMNQQ